MRILFISPNRLRLVAPPLPLGLACLVADAAQEHEVAVVDCMFVPDPSEALQQAVEDFRPEVIGLSVRNVDNQASRHSEVYFPEVREMIVFLRGLTRAPVVVGGSGFSIKFPDLFA